MMPALVASCLGAVDHHLVAVEILTQCNAKNQKCSHIGIDRILLLDVANPPFSLDKWGADEAEADTYNRFWRGVPPKSKGDYAFISHMIEAAVEKEGRVQELAHHRQKVIERNQQRRA